MGLFFSLVADSVGSGDADALANALPHFVQNKGAGEVAAPQYIQYSCSSICASTSFRCSKIQKLGPKECNGKFGRYVTQF